MLLNILQKKPKLENGLTSPKNVERNKKDRHTKTSPNLLAEILLENSKSKILQLENTDISTVSTYEFFIGNDNKCITFTLYNLRRCCGVLEEKIVASALCGQLLDSDSLVRQRKNINLKLYTHRLKITTSQDNFNLNWLIDIDFSTAYSYGTSHGKKILETLMGDLFNEIASKPELSLEDVVGRDWSELIRQQIEISLGSSKYNQIQVLYPSQKVKNVCSY
ncbi:MAG: hypothetical protein N5P05_003633 [Chroococcopsis gigantea SAG 12.99]|jgi:hypothetical protein|nr:hypothetical protein [Chroococcopsis gigantea SAG 12.99]